MYGFWFLILFIFILGYYYFCIIFYSVCEVLWVLIVIKYYYFIIFFLIDIFIYFLLVIKIMLNIKYDMDFVCCEKRLIKY